MGNSDFQKSQAFFIVLYLLLFLEVFKVLDEFFRRSEAFLDFCLLELFIIFSYGIVHVLKFREFLGLFNLASR